MLNPPRRLLAIWAKTLTERELSIQMEWRLSSTDVAGLLGVSRQQVTHYATHGRAGLTLQSRTWGRVGSKRVYSLRGVEKFAEENRWAVQYASLPLWVQKEWAVGEFSPDNHATPATLANDTDREDTP